MDKKPLGHYGVQIVGITWKVATLLRISRHYWTLLIKLKRSKLYYKKNYHTIFFSIHLPLKFKHK